MLQTVCGKRQRYEGAVVSASSECSIVWGKSTFHIRELARIKNCDKIFQSFSNAQPAYGWVCIRWQKGNSQKLEHFLYGMNQGFDNKAERFAWKTAAELHYTFKSLFPTTPKIATATKDETFCLPNEMSSVPCYTGKIKNSSSLNVSHSEASEYNIRCRLELKSSETLLHFAITFWFLKRNERKSLWKNFVFIVVRHNRQMSSVTMFTFGRPLLSFPICLEFNLWNQRQLPVGDLVKSGLDVFVLKMRLNRALPKISTWIDWFLFWQKKSLTVSPNIFTPHD